MITSLTSRSVHTSHLVKHTSHLVKHTSHLVKHTSHLVKIVALIFCLASSFAMPAAFAAEPAKAEVQKAAAVAKVNINTASAEDIAEMLNGVGPKKAEAIVAYRQEFGPFKAVEDLVNVKGIGAATLEKNRELIAL